MFFVSVRCLIHDSTVGCRRMAKTGATYPYVIGIFNLSSVNCCRAWISLFRFVAEIDHETILFTAMNGDLFLTSTQNSDLYPKISVTIMLIFNIYDFCQCTRCILSDRTCPTKNKGGENSNRSDGFDQSDLKLIAYFTEKQRSLGSMLSRICRTNRFIKLDLPCQSL